MEPSLYYFCTVYRILSYLLIAQFLFAIGMKVFLVLDWKINQDLITEKYCENKDKPMMHCNGKCYLAKQLEKLEQQENEERSEHPNPQQLIEKVELISFYSDDMLSFSLSEVMSESLKGERLIHMISQPHLSRVNAPPQA